MIYIIKCRNCGEALGCYDNTDKTCLECNKCPHFGIYIFNSCIPRCCSKLEIRKLCDTCKWYLGD